MSQRNNFTGGAKCFRYAKAMFHPSFTDAEASGFHETSLQSNMKCDVYVRKELYAMSCCYVARPPSSNRFRIFALVARIGPEGLVGMKVDNIKPQVGSLRLPIVLALLCSFTNQVSAQIDLLRYWKADKVARLVSTSCHVRWQRDVHTRQPHVNQLSVLSFKWGRIHFLFQPLWRHVRSCSPPEIAGHGVGHGSP